MNKVKREGETGRTLWLLLFVAASVFCVVFFAARGRFSMPFSSAAVITALAPFQRAASWAGDCVQGMASNVREIMEVHEQNRMLRSEVEELRIQNVKANEYAAENIRLRELLSYKHSAMQFDLVMARVIGREPATWTRMIVIDRGTQHGVQKNMAVVTSHGLVGAVTEAGPISSKVELILDPRAAAGALIQRSRVAGVVKGTPDDSMNPRLVNVPKNEDIVVDDIVVTSGFGGIFPKGIMIGKVTSVKNDGGGLLQYAVINPAVDFQRLEDVAVIVASREAPPEPLAPPSQTPGTETDPISVLKAREAAAAIQSQQTLPAVPSVAPNREASPSTQTATSSPESMNHIVDPSTSHTETSPNSTRANDYTETNPSAVSSSAAQGQPPSTVGAKQ